MPTASTQVFVDMEGNANGSSIYLIGLLVVDNDRQTQFSFWADTSTTAEGHIFAEFLGFLANFDNAHLFYYGSYESRVFKRMSHLAPADTASGLILNRSTNVLSMIYSNIYFPTYSNELKEIGRYLGCTWSDPSASGIQSIV
jgi:predicted RecB family nuclease